MIAAIVICAGLIACGLVSLFVWAIRSESPVDSTDYGLNYGGDPDTRSGTIGAGW